MFTRPLQGLQEITAVVRAPNRCTIWKAPGFACEGLAEQIQQGFEIGGPKRRRSPFSYPLAKVNRISSKDTQLHGPEFEALVPDVFSHFSVKDAAVFQAAVLLLETCADLYGNSCNVL